MIPRMGSARASSWYLLIWGLALVVLGIASLVVHPDFATGDAVTAKRFLGEFETNGWHGVAGLSLGVLALLSFRSARWASVVALIVGIGGGVVPAIVFVLTGNGEAALGLIPVDVADAITLHLVPGIVGVACVLVDARNRRTTPSAVA